MGAGWTVTQSTVRSEDAAPQSPGRLPPPTSNAQNRQRAEGRWAVAQGLGEGGDPGRKRLVEKEFLWGIIKHALELDDGEERTTLQIPPPQKKTHYIVYG